MVANSLLRGHLSPQDVSGCPLAFLPSQLWKLSALRHLRLNGEGWECGLAGCAAAWFRVQEAPSPGVPLVCTDSSSVQPTGRWQPDDGPYPASVFSLFASKRSSRPPFYLPVQARC